MEAKVKVGFGEARRRQAKSDLYDVAKSFGKRHGKKQLIAMFSLQTGYRPQRIEEYLQELVDVGLIEVDGDTILIPGAKEREEEEE